MLKTSRSHAQWWAHRKIDWATRYFDTHGHPHRELILQALSMIRWKSILEVGCGAGANLLRILIAFPGAQVGGFDISVDAIQTAKEKLPKAYHLDTSPAHDLFISDKSCDVILTDACLIYMGPLMIRKVIKEIRRVARGNVIFCEFHSTSFWHRLWLYGKTGYFSHNYLKLLKRYGFYDVQVRKIPAKYWPGTPWETEGYIITASLWL